MSQLDTITVEGFRSIAKIDALALSAMNVVIGPNGSGKSNFIGVFSFLNAVREGHLNDYVLRSGGASRILHFGPKVTSNLRIHISFEAGVNQYEVSLAPSEADELVPVLETGYYWNKVQHERPYSETIQGKGKEAGISGKGLEGVARYVSRHLASWRLYHFHDTSAASPMKQTADVNDNRFLRPDASNLAAFLYYLRLRHEQSYGLIQRAVQRVAPFFEDFALEPQRLSPDKILLEWKHRGSDGYFGASAFSDGTLRFIALATLFLQPDELRPSVILVDEPELGLHPYAVTLLASLAKQASSRSQVILSTQSPLLLDNFEPEQVLVADRIKGGTQLRRLKTIDLTEWLRDYSLGQLWEKNELGGRPTGE